MQRYRVIRKYWEERDRFVYCVQRERLVRNKLLPFLSKTEWLSIDNNGRAYETFIGGWDEITEATDIRTVIWSDENE